MVKISAPGKLFISGEWSILEPNAQGIAAAVNRRVYVELGSRTGKYVSVDDFGIKDVQADYREGSLSWRTQDPKTLEKLKFTKAAIETTLRYLDEDLDFDLRSWGEDTNIKVDGEMRKVGFGSSAASVVAFVGSLLHQKGYDLTKRETKDIVYKLSMLAHCNAQGKIGSGYDVAASTYGGLFVYQSAPKWLTQQLEGGRSLKDLVDSKWDEFVIDELWVPENFNLLVAWTKQSASTIDMVNKVNEYKKQNAEDHRKLITTVSSAAAGAISAWKTGDEKRFLEVLRENETALSNLGKASGVDIETEDLKKLSELANQVGAAGKLSGAGGGDCGIAVCFDSKVAGQVKKVWKENKIYLLEDVTIDKEGIRID